MQLGLNTTVYDIDLHCNGVECEDCGKRFLPSNEYDKTCFKCGTDPDNARNERDEKRDLKK
jgi:hypothetical protein